jgi:hypothetical protein
MRTALGLLGSFIAGVVVFAITLGFLVWGGDPDEIVGDALDALPVAVGAGVVTVAAATTWVIVVGRRGSG